MANAKHILTSKVSADITSIGCHTNLWNFQNKKYHRWVKQEGIQVKLPPLLSCEAPAGCINNTIAVGAGLHDSSSALIPYFAAFQEPFVLISTGTWCITMNPFNHTQLSDYELHQDCLCYLSYQGKPVKASRLFAGYEHEQQIKKLAVHFNKAENYYITVNCDTTILKQLHPARSRQVNDDSGAMQQQSAFAERDLQSFASYEYAYHQLIKDIIEQQVKSTKLVLSDTPVKRIFVDGGFSKNSLPRSAFVINFYTFSPVAKYYPPSRICPSRITILRSAISASWSLWVTITKVWPSSLRSRKKIWCSS